MEAVKKQVRLTKNAALAKMQNWCAYQERSQYEVRNKLYEWNVYPAEVDQILSALIEENFLNEERFARAYVSGKFKIKKWGRQKIKQGLKGKKVPDKMIAKALLSIDPDEYLQAIYEAAIKKHPLISEKNPLKHKFKLVAFLRGRGFEQDLIFDVLKANNLY